MSGVTCEAMGWEHAKPCDSCTQVGYCQARDEPPAEHLTDPTESAEEATDHG